MFCVKAYSQNEEGFTVMMDSLSNPQQALDKYFGL